MYTFKDFSPYREYPEKCEKCKELPPFLDPPEIPQWENRVEKQDGNMYGIYRGHRYKVDCGTIPGYYCYVCISDLVRDDLEIICQNCNEIYQYQWNVNNSVGSDGISGGFSSRTEDDFYMWMTKTAKDESGLNGLCCDNCVEKCFEMGLLDPGNWAFWEYLKSEWIEVQ